jgi:hypothetical protein
VDDEITFERVNVHIVNGSGSTSGKNGSALQVVKMVLETSSLVITKREVRAKMYAPALIIL